MKENQRNNMKTMCSVALFTAVICILSIWQIPLPSGVPITLQTFALALCGYVIGAKLGAISATLYLLLGLIGLPVYAGMAAGPGVLFGPTGGFIFGFIFLSLFCGLGVQKKIPVSIGLGVVGLAICHSLGVIQLMLYYKMTLLSAFLAGSAPYIVKDVLSLVGAYFISLVLRKALRSANLMDFC